MKVNGQLEGAQLEQIAAASTTPTSTGRMYIDVVDPTNAFPTFYNGTGWKRFRQELMKVTAVKTSTYTVTRFDDVVLCNAGSAAFSVNLLSAATYPGQIITIMKAVADTSTNAVTVDGSGSETIGGVLTVQLIYSGDYITIVSDGSNWHILQNKIGCIYRLQGENGNGSTNNKIKLFSTVTLTLGNAFTGANSATLGASATINIPGVYAFTVSDSANGSDTYGLSLNSTQLTTAISSITAADRLALGQTSAADKTYTVSWTGPLKAGDVVRPHTSGSTDGANPAYAVFAAARVG